MMKRLSSRIQEKTLLYKVLSHKDAQAFSLLYDRYVEKIYRFILLKVSNKQDAEDLTSEVFLKVWKYLTDGKQKNVESLSGLIYTTARNVVVNEYRRRAKKQQEPLEQAHTIHIDDSLHTKTEQKDDTERLFKAIRQLKQEYQEVILLKHVEGYSTEEIAVITNKKRTAVRVTLHRATKKLQDLYSL